MVSNTSHKKLKRLLALLALFALAPLTMAFAIPKADGGTPSPDSTSVSEESTFCWAELEPQFTKPTKATAQNAQNTERYVCAPSKGKLDAKIAEQFDLIVVENKKEYENYLASSRAASGEALAASYSVGTLWDDINYSGGGITFSTSNPTTCYGGTQYYSWNYVGARWNDRTSSYDGHNACQGKIFENAGFSGTRLGYHDCVSYVGGAMNDETSSVIWHLTDRYSCY